MTVAAGTIISLVEPARCGHHIYAVEIDDLGICCTCSVSILRVSHLKAKVAMHAQIQKVLKEQIPLAQSELTDIYHLQRELSGRDREKTRAEIEAKTKQMMLTTRRVEMLVRGLSQSSLSLSR